MNSNLGENAIFTLDLDGRISSWNEGARKVLGFSRQQAVGRSFEIVLTPEDRQAGVADKQIHDALNQACHEDERWYQRQNGERFFASCLLSPIHSKDGQVQGLIKILRDQTNGRHWEQQLQARARQQAAVASFGQKALAGGDLQGLLDEAVETVSQTLGNELCKVLRLLPDGQALHLEAGVGWQPGLVGHATVSAEAASQAGFTLATDQPVVVRDLRKETRFSGPSLLLEHGVVSGMSVIIAGRGGRPWGVLGAHTRSYRDYSRNDVNFLLAMANILATAIDRKEVERRLHQLNETLEQRVAKRTQQVERQAGQLRQLTAELASAEQRERRRLAQSLHDGLQQLLVVARMLLEQVQRQPLPADVKTALQTAQDVLQKCDQASRSLTLELYPPVLYDRGLAAAVEWLARRFQKNTGLLVTTNLDPSADPADSDLQAFLFQAIRELLLNVVKHAHARHATIDLRQYDQMVKITVEDDGVGCNPSRAVEFNAAQGGFGLFNIRERLRWLGGTMQVDSAPSRGMRVSLTCPKVPHETTRQPDTPPLPATGTAVDSTRESRKTDRPIRIMLADDHRIMREGLAGLLYSEKDFEIVAEAADGREVIELIDQAAPDVVVMDVSMPRMDGVEATRWLARHKPHVRVIGLSMHEKEDLAQAMRQAGAVAYLTKGGPSDDLIEAIRQGGQPAESR